MITESTPTSAVREDVLRGLAWKLLSLVVGQGARTVVTIAVRPSARARTTTASQAMVLVFSSLVAVFSDLALGAALVQRDEADRGRTLDGVLDEPWRPGGLHAGPASAGRPDRRLLRPARGASALFMAMSVSFVVTSAPPYRAAARAARSSFRSLAVRMMASVVIGAVVGWGRPSQGYGAWAIILQQVAGAVASTALLWAVTPWRPKPRYSMAALRSLAGFFSQRLRHPAALLRQPQRGQPAGRAVPGRRLARRLLDRLHDHARAVQPGRQPVPGGAVSGDVADAGRPAPDGGRLAALQPADRGVSLPALVGVAVVAPDLVDVVLGRANGSIATPVIQILIWVGPAAVPPAAELDGAPGVGPHRRPVRYSVIVSCGSLAAFVARPALGRGRVAIRLCALEHGGRAVLPLADERRSDLSPPHLGRACAAWSRPPS